MTLRICQESTRSALNIAFMGLYVPRGKREASQARVLCIFWTKLTRVALWTERQADGSTT